MQIAWIGLGNMGGPMAENLVRAGYALLGYDPVAPVWEAVPRAASLKQACEGADAVVMMLPHAAAVQAVASEIVPRLRAGVTLVDCSTIDVQTAREAALLGARHGVHVLDAPVSGGVSGAEAGSLTFMIGGAQEALARVQPLFDVMGSRAVHCGESGAGQAAKLCNNMILGITMIATCEAFALGERLGLAPERLFEVVSTASGASWSTNSYCPVPGVGPQSPADRGYQPGFASALMLKDLRLAQEAAKASGARADLGAHAMQIYEAFVEEAGQGARDFSALFEAFRAGA